MKNLQTRAQARVFDDNLDESFPEKIDALSAWYDISDLSSLIYDEMNRVALVADKSGNSPVNVLVLNGVSGNYASSPDSSTLSITGDVDVRVYVSCDDWTPAADARFLQKFSSAQNGGYGFGINNTTGLLSFFWSDDVLVFDKSSTLAPTIPDFGWLWLRATLDVDNGAGGNTVTFYTSTDGTNWTQLGNPVITGGTTVIDDGGQILAIGASSSGGNVLSGKIERVQIYAGLTGSDLRFDCNFGTVGKLATSFPESSSHAATVTINTFGGTGARISGARDLVQMSVASQPVLTMSPTGNYLTFDGSDDYLKAAAFALVQPETVMFVGSQLTWTNNDILIDGGIGAGAVGRMVIGQGSVVSGSPGMMLYAGGAAVTNDNTELPLGVLGVVTGVFNSASSTLRVNRHVQIPGNPGANGANGVTLSADGVGNAPANIIAREVIIYPSALSLHDQDRLAVYAGKKWRFLV